MADHEHNGSDRQDIRVAVVMNGGVSLAVWISGVTLELHELSTARRGGAATYRPLLDLLDADARVDVIAGTSAGGINGAFLALGISRGHDLKLLRDLWRSVGGLEDLLRSPLASRPPSVLQGDTYFLPQIRRALGQLTAGGTAVRENAPPVELYLTGTLWGGRTTSFTDDMATVIAEVDHDATFRFQSRPGALGGRACGDLDSAEVVDELAAAARCTASFPGAFEPHWVGVGGTDGLHDTRWVSTAGRVNFARSQYVVDGGILLNKPIRPVLQAIYQQPAAYQVRRLLAYVAPGPAAAPASAPPAPIGMDAAPGPLPQAPEVLLAVLTRLRATDSVSRELTEIRTRNADASSRRRARGRLAAAMTAVATELSAEAWQGYLDVRVDHAARTIGPLIARGQVAAAGRWSEAELVQALREVINDRRGNASAAASFVPHGCLEDAVTRTGDDWDWGATTAQRLADMTVDVLKRAVWLAPLNSRARDAIVTCRRNVAQTLVDIQEDRRRLDRYWSTVATGGAGTVPGVPGRADDGLGVAGNRAQLMDWLGTALDGWEQQRDRPGRDRRALLYGQVFALAFHLADAAGAIALVAEKPNLVMDPDGREREQLESLSTYLLTPSGDTLGPRPWAADVLARMLRLDVLQLTFDGATQEVEQEVELAQFTARHPDCLTGLQLHHFGAFYRPSWRVNDWIHGRLDGAAHLIRILLAPQRLRQRAGTVAVSDMLEQMEACAVPQSAAPADRAWLRQRWTASAKIARDYLENVEAGQVPAHHSERMVLGRLADVVTGPIHLAILREDLPALARAVRDEGDQAPEASRTWLRSFDAANRAAGFAPMSADQIFDLWAEAAQIGREQITDEVGGATLARTAAHLASVTVNTVSAPKKAKAVTSVLGAVRGYTLVVWAMVTFLTSPERFGKRVVELAVAVGAALLALALLVPGVPLALVLLGVLLVIAAASAAAVLTPGGNGVGLRLATAGLIVAAALGGYVYWDWHANGLRAGVMSALLKSGVVLLVVLLGWWISTVRPRKSVRIDGE